MATPGFYLAEAHVMRNLYKEKMKKSMEEERAMPGVGAGAGDSRVVKKSSGCFRIFKKIHPSNGRVVVNSAKREEEEGVGKWGSTGSQ
ncbi:hypothetical protein PanWU01x14_131590 [Parasponia andersonii]|uniref:Uncharacterized protein n=1 Tax=Parasponia andersonii TaxID=3476 RepID=A0A2P5CR32_PARAD|nr:hypothetical protein PanWU01x14_131590 [Parasponia andersonii]